MIDIGYFVSAYINEGTREIILAQTVSQQPTLQVGAAQVRVVTCEIKNIKTCPEVTGYSSEGSIDIPKKQILFP